MIRRLEPMLCGRYGDGEYSFDTLHDDLATLTENTFRVGEYSTFEQISRPTEFQQGVFNLLDVKPRLAARRMHSVAL